MKLSKVALCAAVALGAMTIANIASAQTAPAAPAAAPAAPEATPAFTFKCRARITDYVFRGIKQSVDGGLGTSPEAFGGVDWAGGPNLYAGVWLSNTGFSSSNGIETDLYAGWKPKRAGPVRGLDLGVIYYTNNNSSDHFVTNDANTLEWKGAASISAGPATLGAAVYYSNDYISSE